MSVQQDKYNYISKLILRNEQAIEAYGRAYEYARQKEFKEFLHEQYLERMRFRDRLNGEVNELSHAPMAMRDESPEWTEMAGAINARDSKSLIEACVHEELTECDECQEFLHGHPSRKRLSRIIEDHYAEVRNALSKLHTMQELSGYRNSESRPWLIHELMKTAR